MKQQPESSKERRKKVIRHSILTSLALDTVGNSFDSGYTPEERQAWYKGERTEFPPNLKISEITPSFNSELFIVTLLSLAESTPVHVDDLQTALEELEKVYDSYATRSKYLEKIGGKYYKYLTTDRYIGIPILSVSIAVAYYSAFVGLQNLTFLSLCEKILNLFSFVDEDYEASLFISFIIYRLVSAGYFCYESLEETIDHKLISGQFERVIKTLMKNHLNAKFLRTFDFSLVDGLEYLQRILCYVVFLMLRVGTAYPKTKLQSLPREQVPDLFNYDRVSYADMGFIYGAICTVSEQLHPLIPQSLRESAPFSDVVDSALDYN